MAFQTLLIASMDGGNATLSMEYNDQTMRGVAAIAVNNSFYTMLIRCERVEDGIGLVATIPPHTTRRVGLPSGLKLGIDEETGEPSITGSGHDIRILVQLG
jgi:hypothetical protein